MLLALESAVRPQVPLRHQLRPSPWRDPSSGDKRPTLRKPQPGRQGKSTQRVPREFCCRGFSRTGRVLKPRGQSTKTPHLLERPGHSDELDDLLPFHLHHEAALIGFGAELRLHINRDRRLRLRRLDQRLSQQNHHSDVACWGKPCGDCAGRASLRATWSSVCRFAKAWQAFDETMLTSAFASSVFAFFVDTGAATVSSFGSSFASIDRFARFGGMSSVCRSAKWRQLHVRIHAYYF